MEVAKRGGKRVGGTIKHVEAKEDDEENDWERKTK